MVLRDAGVGKRVFVNGEERFVSRRYDTISKIYPKDKEGNRKPCCVGDAKNTLTKRLLTIGPKSKVNPYWLNTDEDMFNSDKAQWLQNYRRKRWIQIRNILYNFMIEE